MRTKSLTGIVVAAAVGLISASSASAETFCVHSNVNCNGTPAATLSAALTQAASNGAGRDTVQLPAGTFADLPALDGAGNPVDIVGAGADKTVLTQGGGFGDMLRIYDPTSTISNLEILMPDTDQFTGLHVKGGTVDHVKVASTDTAHGSWGIVVGPGQLAKIQHTSVELSNGPTWMTNGVFIDFNAAAAVTDSSIQAVQGVYLQGGEADVERDRIWAQTGIEALTAGYAYVANTSIRTPGAYPHPGEEYALRVRGEGTTEMDAMNLTAYGDANPNSDGVEVIPMPDGSSSRITLTDSVVAHYASAAYVESLTGDATLNTVFSAYDSTTLTGNGLVGHHAQDDVELAGVDPGFANAANGDFRLRPSSPLVDAGDPSNIASNTGDLDGNNRVVDGGSGSPRTDIGAFEYQPAPAPDTQSATVTGDPSHAPEPQQTVSATPQPSSQPTALMLTRLRLTPWTFDIRSGTILSFQLSQPAAVKVVVERAKARRWAKAGSFTLNKGAGPARVAFKGRIGKHVLRPGRYRLRAVASNAAGMRSEASSARFRIKR